MFSKKKNLIILSAVILTTACLIVPRFVYALDINGALLSVSSWIANQIIYVAGQLLLIAINILIKVASFNDFINANIVNIGWVIIRDIANMAIVIALMVIAFYTVLNKQSYEYKKMLPKLVLAAILVNFSKSIAGALIDLGQVVMMTFVHAFETIAAGNLTYGFGLQDMLSVRNAAQGAGMGAEISDWTVFGALVLGVIMVVVALGVVVSMAVMLLMRIIVLWLLIIFSPVAYVAGLIPGGDKYASQWWQNFGKYITFGPVLAFLFWLSMTVLSQVTTQNRLVNLERLSAETMGGGAASPESYAYFASQVSSPQRIFDYMVTVALLIMCMIFAKQAGVMGSQFAGNMYDKMQGAGRWIARRPQVLGRKAGGAAWQRAKTSYAGAGLAALAQRGRTSWVGKRFGFDKEYTETQAAKKAARMTEWMGGKRGEGAIRSFEYQQGMKKQKEMEEKGLLGGGDDALRALYRSKLKAGKMDEARAVMMKMASGKDSNLKTEDLQAYEQAMNIKRGSGSRGERDYMKFAEDLQGMQKASGDTMAEYKFGVERDSSGRLNYISDLSEKVKEDFSKKKEADFNDKGLFKAFDEEKPEFRAVLDELDNKTDMQALGTDGRRGYANIIQRMLARDADSADSFKLSDKEKDDYTGLLEKMHAKRFVRGTGEAITNNSHPMYSGLNAEGKKEVDTGQVEFNKATKSDKLKEVADKFRRKKAEETRGDLYYGREILTEADKGTDEVIRPMLIGNEIQSDLYQMANNERGNDDPQWFVNSVSGYVKNLDKNILAGANKKGDSNIINPETNKPYSHTELYWKSDLGKNIDTIKKNFRNVDYNNLSPEEQKDFIKELKNRVDSMIFSAQRSAAPTRKAKWEGKSFGEVERDRLMKNRIVNRDSLGSVMGSVGKLQTTDLSSKERNKIVKSIERNIKRAAKDSSSSNKDNKELNANLSELERMSKGIKAGTTKLDEFKNKADVVFEQFKAK